MTQAPPHILVVDDEPNICTGVRRILEREEFRVTTANNGTAALDAIGEGPQIFVQPCCRRTDQFVRFVQKCHPNTVVSATFSQVLACAFKQPVAVLFPGYELAHIADGSQQNI